MRPTFTGVICFPQPINLNIIVIQKHPHRHTQNNVWPNIWGPCTLVKLTHIIHQYTSCPGEHAWQSCLKRSGSHCGLTLQVVCVAWYSHPTSSEIVGASVPTPTIGGLQGETRLGHPSQTAVACLQGSLRPLHACLLGVAVSFLRTLVLWYYTLVSASASGLLSLPLVLGQCSLFLWFALLSPSLTPASLGSSGSSRSLPGQPLAFMIRQEQRPHGVADICCLSCLSYLQGLSLIWPKNRDSMAGAYSFRKGELRVAPGLAVHVMGAGQSALLGQWCSPELSFEGHAHWGSQGPSPPGA